MAKSRASRADAGLQSRPRGVRIENVITRGGRNIIFENFWTHLRRSTVCLASLEPVPDTVPTEPTIAVLSKIAAPSKACRSAVALAPRALRSRSGPVFSSGHSPGKNQLRSFARQKEEERYRRPDAAICASLGERG